MALEEEYFHLLDLYESVLKRGAPSTGVFQATILFLEHLRDALKAEEVLRDNADSMLVMLLVQIEAYKKRLGQQPTKHENYGSEAAEQGRSKIDILWKELFILLRAPAALQIMKKKAKLPPSERVARVRKREQRAHRQKWVRS